MALKKVHKLEVQDYTGKKRSNYSYSDVVQINVPKWHQVLNNIQDWAGSKKKIVDPYNDPSVIVNFKGKK
jgi:hypothetical protein